MKLRIVSLIAVVAAACAISFSIPESTQPLLTFDRNKRTEIKPAPARSVMKHERNTRAFPINADLTLRHVAPGSPDGPVDH